MLQLQLLSEVNRSMKTDRAPDTVSHGYVKDWRIDMHFNSSTLQCSFHESANSLNELNDWFTQPIIIKLILLLYLILISYIILGMEELCTQYPRNYLPRTLKTMHPVPQARNHVDVPGTLETMHFHQRSDNKSGITHQCWTKVLGTHSSELGVHSAWFREYAIRVTWFRGY